MIDECPKCGHTELRMHTQVTLSTPASMYAQFSKSNLRKKEVHLESANWETSTIICPKCYWTNEGYGNYVTRLRVENEELKKRISKLEKGNE